MGESDRWPELLNLVKCDDGFCTRDSGLWTADKLWFWHRYLEITTKAMVPKTDRWTGGLIYIDLFCGPGVCVVRDTGVRVPGSPLLAAYARSPFSKIILCEMDKKCADACEARMLTSPAADRFVLVRGDCNARIEEITQHIPPRALTLAFIDPNDIGVHFETLRALASGRQCDFLMLFADATDLARNVDLYERTSDSKLDAMFGPNSGWRDAWAALPDQSGPKKRQFFARMYQQQIARVLGYKGFREKVINGPHGPMYNLIYASKHERGLEFWDKVTKKDRQGQTELF